MSEPQDGLNNDIIDDPRALPNWQASYDLAMKQLHANAVTTQNPIYAWQALQFCIWAQQTLPGAGDFVGDRLALPSWIGRYLSDVSGNICNLSVGLDIRTDPKIEDKKEADLRSIKDIAGFFEVVEKYPPKHVAIKKAPSLLAQALGLTRKSWSAFGAYASDQTNIEAYHKIADLRETGLSYEAALQQVADTADLDSSVVRKRAQDGAKLIAEEARRSSKATARQN